MTRAEQAAIEKYPDFSNDFASKAAVEAVRDAFYKGFEQGQKEMIEKAILWLDEHFFDNSHHSGRGFYSLIKTSDFDSIKEMFEDFRKAMGE